jgi:CheY-like chemotaxis protein
VEHARARPFDAVVTDVVMPDVGGRELVAELRRRAPRLPVLYVSGYAGDAVADLELAEGTVLVTKPFTGAGGGGPRPARTEKNGGV